MPEHKPHHGHKFNPAHLDRLRDPERLRFQNPEVIWPVIADQPVTTLVDIGAGIGFFAIPFARKMPGGRVYACDTSAEMLEHLKGALAAQNVANVTPLQSEEVRVPLEDHLADVVFMANLHHELDRPQESLAECLRLLKVGGTVAIVDWIPEPTPTGPPVEVRIPPETVRGQLTLAGFHQITSHPLLPYHYFVTATA